MRKVGIEGSADYSLAVAFARFSACFLCSLASLIAGRS